MLPHPLPARQLFKCGINACVDITNPGPPIQPPNGNVPIGYQSGIPTCVNSTLAGTGGVQPPCEMNPTGPAQYPVVTQEVVDGDIQDINW